MGAPKAHPPNEEIFVRRPTDIRPYSLGHVLSTSAAAPKSPNVHSHCPECSCTMMLAGFTSK